MMGAIAQTDGEKMMSLAPKILWAEGLLLGQHLFQRQDAYHEMRLQRMAFALNPHLWGVRHVQWIEENLANNYLSPLAMSLIFQDGEMVEAPASDRLPLQVDLSALPIDEQVFTFYAALPSLKPHGGNAQGDGRYLESEADTPDLFSGAPSAEVSFLNKTVHLLSQLDSRDGFVSMPVARICRLPEGGFELDATFVAPSVSIGAAAPLGLMLDRLICKLTAKIDTLRAVHQQTHATTFEVHIGDISSFWMLNAVSSAAASLLHCSRSGRQHPEVLYEKLMSLAGSLMTFSSKYNVKELPSYSHDEPGPGFARLEAIIRDLVDIVSASKFFTIALALDERRRTHYRGTLDAEKVNSKTELYLAITADMPALELVATVPRIFKVGSPENIETLIMSALPGIGLLHMPQVPAAIPARPRTVYFHIENKGALYENMLKAQSIGIYVPDGINGLSIELLGIAY
jgi:type VI secretion system protein ImpJ